jgi:dihydroneopterin aldolase
VSDGLEITGLRVLGIHGALPAEQLTRQPFEIDLVVHADLAVAGLSDDLADAIDYGVVVERVSSVVRDGHFQLLEALAEAIATSVLADERAEAVTVAVRKLRPPVPADLATAGVRITRRREND